MPSFYYCVVTKVPNPTEEAGNLATAFPLYRRSEEPGPANDYLGKYTEVDVSLSMFLCREVFSLGEILLLDAGTDREIGGDGRKPSKWFIETESFDTAEAAVARALEVTDGG